MEIIAYTGKIKATTHNVFRMIYIFILYVVFYFMNFGGLNKIYVNMAFIALILIHCAILIYNFKIKKA